MSPALRFTPTPNTMNGRVFDAPAFPGESFGFAFPECIGDAAQPSDWNNIVTTWTQTGSVWVCNGSRSGELSYVFSVTAGYDWVDFDQQLTNESNRAWANSFAFDCFQCAQSHSIADHECIRHRAGLGDRTTPLIALPRKFSPRPTVQLYDVQGAPPVAQIPFANQFQATPNVVLEGWLAIQSRDGSRLVAAVARPALFLFNNMEYSCIHAAPSFGPLAPGQTGHARTRVYFVQSSLADWYARMKEELGG
jgi:hypothetical protein